MEGCVAKGLYLSGDGRVVVAYGTRQILISPAQYKADGYKPPCDKLPAEAPYRARKSLQCRQALRAAGKPTKAYPVDLGRL